VLKPALAPGTCVERRRVARTAARGDAPTGETTTPTWWRTRSHHLLAVRNLIATTNNESYHETTSELPPATSHEYAEWDFSVVPDPMMFQWFLVAADYWFDCSDDSSIGSYDLARE
jgi:hypothetical protein